MNQLERDTALAAASVPAAATDASSESDDLFATIYEQTQRVLGPTCGFYVVKYEGGFDRVRLVYLVDGGKVSVPETIYSLEACDAIRERRVVADDGFARQIASDVVTSIAAPMIRNQVVLGSFGAFSREPRFYDARDANAIAAIAELCALILENAQLHRQLHALSLTDPLTEIPNRRHLDIFLEKEFAAARRGRKLSVLLFDLDHFKEYNDRAGHPAGDEVLRAFARLLIQHTRAMNLAVRYGGDEFITILADTDEAGALTHAERILREINNDAVMNAAGVRACVGIASYTPDMEKPDDLVRAADRNLYVRKNARPSLPA